jgi:hypothetical protein
MSTNQRVGKANPILGVKLPLGLIEKSNNDKFTLVPIFFLNYLWFCAQVVLVSLWPFSSSPISHDLGNVFGCSLVK